MLSSITNFLLGLLVARTVEPRELGAFGLAYAVYALALGASRALVSEPLVVRFSGASNENWRVAVAGAAGASVVLGAIIGAASLLLAALLGRPAGIAFGLLGIALPGLLIQDAWRFCFFALGRGARAFGNDLVWALVLIPGAVVLMETNNASMAALMAVWAAAGWAAAAVGLIQTRVLPRPNRALRWVREQRDIAYRFFGEFAVSSGATHLSLFLIGVVTTLAELGRLRAGQMILGPLNVLFMGAGLVAVAEAARFLRESLEKMAMLTRVVSALLTGGTVAWVLIAWLIPDSAGEVIMGRNWAGGHSLLIPLSIGAIGFAVSYGAMTGLRALAAARSSLRARVFDAISTLLLSLSGAVVAGATGAAWGYATAGCLRVANWWWHFHGARRLYSKDQSVSVPTESALSDPESASGIV